MGENRIAPFEHYRSNRGGNAPDLLNYDRGRCPATAIMATCAPTPGISIPDPIDCNSARVRQPSF